MKSTTFKYHGKEVTIQVWAEGNDCMYPRITTRKLSVSVGGKCVDCVDAGRHQGYDANQHIELSPADISRGTEIARQFITRGTL